MATGGQPSWRRGIVLSVMESSFNVEQQLACASCAFASYGISYSAYSYWGHQPHSCDVCQLWCSASQKVSVLSSLQFVISRSTVLGLCVAIVTALLSSYVTHVFLDGYILITVILVIWHFKEDIRVYVYWLYFGVLQMMFQVSEWSSTIDVETESYKFKIQVKVCAA